jgi:hypothetical protein
MCRTGKSMVELAGASGISRALQRSTNGSDWLIDLAEIFNKRDQGTAPKEPKLTQRLGPKETLNYLIMRDLAAVFEFVSGQSPSRRIDPASGRDYGPFLDVCGICVVRNIRKTRRTPGCDQRLGC